MSANNILMNIFIFVKIASENLPHSFYFACKEGFLT